MQEIQTKKEEFIYFDFNELLPIGMLFIVLGIGLAYGLQVLADVRDDTCTSLGSGYSVHGDTCYSSYTNSTVNTEAQRDEAFTAGDLSITAVAKLPAKLGLIVTIVVAVIIIGLLIRYLLVRY